MKNNNQMVNDIRSIADSAVSKINTAVGGTIISYNSATNRATVKRSEQNYLKIIGAFRIRIYSMCR